MGLQPHTKISPIRPVVPEIRNGGMHVRTGSLTPPLTCVKRLANWSLTTYQVSAQPARPFPRYKTLGYICRCALAHVQMHPTYGLWDMLRYLVSNHTLILVAIIRANPELQLYMDPF